MATARTGTQERTRGGRHRRAVVALTPVVASAAAIVLASCSAPAARRVGNPVATSTTVSPSTTVAAPGGGTPARTASLVSYTGCAQLLSQLKQEALSEVGPYGLASGGGPVLRGGPVRAAAGPTDGMSASAGTAAPAAPEAAAAGSTTAGSASAGAGSSSADHSTTNNQEAGVDEPDLAKTDGHLMVVLRHDPVGLQVVDVSTPSPHLDGFLPLAQTEGATGLFLAGSTAVVVGAEATGPRVYAGGAPPQAGAGATTGGPAVAPPARVSQTTVTVVSLADRQHPSVVRTLSLGGQEIDARLIGGRVLVVTQSTPDLPFVSPGDDSSTAQQEALARNRDLVRSSDLADWLPSVTTGASAAPQLPACPDVMHPVVASGLGTVSVVPIDPASGTAGQQVSIVGSGSVLYASTASLYVATTSWSDQVAQAQGGTASETTDIHGFSLTSGAPRYVGSGSVPGTLIGQYAMSEDHGVLRVATTVGQAYAAPRDTQAAPSDTAASDNMITVLQPAAGALVPIGQVSGLGRGERIYGVRFVGSLGYVVTFRQTDPLYVVDLTDPRRPVVRGSLQLPGFSAYLHPLGAGRLLGLGQETDQGSDGVQVSVFDVSDPANPILDARRYYPASYSAAEQDPHGFLWWPAAGLAVIPVQQYGDGSGGGFSGELVLRVGAGGSLTEVGRISQPSPGPSPTPGPATGAVDRPAGPAPGVMMAPAYSPGIERALIVGGLIYTVSDAGVMASDLASLRQVAWLPYPG